MICPVCGSYDNEIVSKLDSDQFHEYVLKCNVCESTFTKTRDSVIMVEDKQEDSFLGHCKDCVDGDCECIENK
jgi:formate dehydrogenase maturation protein FdhE